MLHLTASKTLFAVAFVFILATSSSVPAVVSSATPTPTAIAAQPDLLEFPLPMPSDEQLTEARDCAFAPETHYPSKLTIDELQTAYKVVTACEWAELALAYSTRRSSDDAPLPPQAIAAYLEAVRRNPAIPNSLSMLSVFSAVPLVSAPAFVSQMITQVRLHNR